MTVATRKTLAERERAVARREAVVAERETSMDDSRVQLGPRVLMLPAHISPLAEAVTREWGLANGVAVQSVKDEQPGTPAWQRALAGLARMRAERLR